MLSTSSTGTCSLVLAFCLVLPLRLQLTKEGKSCHEIRYRFRMRKKDYLEAILLCIVPMCPMADVDQERQSPGLSSRQKASTIDSANGRTLFLPCDLPPAFDRVPHRVLYGKRSNTV
jgi:hypothetical protein